MVKLPFSATLMKSVSLLIPNSRGRYSGLVWESYILWYNLPRTWLGIGLYCIKSLFGALSLVREQLRESFELEETAKGEVCLAFFFFTPWGVPEASSQNSNVLWNKIWNSLEFIHSMSLLGLKLPDYIVSFAYLNPELPHLFNFFPWVGNNTLIVENLARKKIISTRRHHS